MRIYEPTIKREMKGVPTIHTWELFQDMSGYYHLFLFEKGTSPVYAHFYDNGRKQVDVDLKAIWEGTDFSYWEGNDLPNESYEAVLNDPMAYVLVDVG